MSVYLRGTEGPQGVLRFFKNNYWSWHSMQGSFKCQHICSAAQKCGNDIASHPH